MSPPLPDDATFKGVAAVDRALTILMCFSQSDDSLSLAELNAQTGFYKSTLLRLLASLELFGFIQQEESKKYRLGWAVGRLGTIYRQGLGLEKHIRPVLRALQEATGESASFYRREGDMRSCLFREESRHMVRDHVDEGALLPLQVGAAGHVLNKFSGGTPEVELPVTSLGERDPEVAAMAVPVLGVEATLIGALTVSGPVLRFTKERMAMLAPFLVQQGAELSRVFGAMDITVFKLPENLAQDERR
ncbi:IclR family transcriptional regulator [Sedimenticola sp.]|uniref:IclR family transcriptional regulator n=1 Tax=Sedimenticola sp. TaxID=1940285 RepID=UPI003D14A6DD